MPGRIMNHVADGALGARDRDLKKRSHDGKLINGERGAPRKDASSTNGASSAPAVNGASLSLSGSAADQFAQLPPEIQHLASEFYHPLSKMLLRIVQECFNDLSEVLQAMSDVPVGQHSNGMMNGFGIANGGSDPEASKQKKLLLMQFAQTNRSKFIKLLVLADWGKRSSSDVSKLIDLFQWAREQGNHMDAVDAQMETMKVMSNYTKENNPDLKTALEILGTGKAGWIPDMGFVPPDAISTETALKLLRYMNTSLSIRLNVHETLPRHLRKWRIGSGRATFIVDNEFEFDVISFVEDLSDQWHFIDLRLLFSPAPSITIGSRFLQQLKMQLDWILSQPAGLSGCFDFLHNFVLTHKITVLKSQAYELLRAGWASSLKVEPVHRALVLQYWTDRPGRKNWIEIGLSSNRPKDGKISWKGYPLSSITVRWFRQGVEVTDVDFDFDWKKISLERMLKRVISLHTAYLLEAARGSFNASMRVQANLSPLEPADCTLDAALGNSANKATLSVEPMTGRYILRPANHISASAEHMINQGRDPQNISSTLTQVLARTLQDLIQKSAQQLGWLPVPKNDIRIDAVKLAVRRDVLQYSLHWPRGWPKTWALGAILDASGESWWILRLDPGGTTIEFSQQVSMQRQDGKALSINRTLLTSLERVAAQLVAVCVNMQKLKEDNKPYELRNEGSVHPHPKESQHLLHGWVLELFTSDLLESKPGEEQWLEPRVRLIFQGPRADNNNVWHVATGTVIKSEEAALRKLISASPQTNIGFSASGEFFILLTSPFGQSVIGELRARLRDVNRLRQFTATLEKRKMVPRASSLQEVQFQYGKNYTAAVNFGKHEDIRVHLGQTNPHNRIHKFLSELINGRCLQVQDAFAGESVGLDRFCTTLVLTRPIMSGFQDIETEEQGKGNYRNPMIHTRGIGHFRLSYQNPLCSFDVHLKQKDDQVHWLIEDNERKALDFRPLAERTPNYKRLQTLQEALQRLFRESGERWWGVRSGIIASIDSVPLALKRLHETVLSCAVAVGQKPFAETESKPSLASLPGQPASQPPRKISVVGGKQQNAVKQEVIELD